MRHNEYLLNSNFFSKVVSSFNTNINSDVPKKIIIVEHSVINSLAFIKYLSVNYEVYYIPKPKSIDKKVLETIKPWCNIVQTNRKELKQDSVIDFISQIVQNDTFAIIDIGGYFATQIYKIQSIFKGQLLKVIEDTENGYQKYAKVFKRHSINTPVLSVARSPLKIEEDYLVGHEIVIKSEMFLADYGTTFLGKKILVIGFGKIGVSISENLNKRGAIVYVADKQALRLADALARGFQVTNDFYKMISDMDIVYVANGEQSIDIQKLKKLSIQNTLYLFSVTSAEDTYKHSEEIQNLKLYGHNGGYRILKSKNKKSIILANSGNAINFTYTISTLASYVQLTQAEMSVMLIQNYKPKKYIISMNENDREKIARYWLSEVQKTSNSFK